MAGHNVVVFDIANRQFNWWPVAISILLIALGLLELVFRKRAQRHRIAGVPILLGLGLAIWWLGFHWAQYGRLVRTRTASDFLTTVGVAHVTRVSAPGEHGSDTFTVNGTLFEVSPWLISEGFNDRIVDGGPRLDGRCVEVAYTARKEIVRIKMMDSENASCSR